MAEILTIVMPKWGLSMQEGKVTSWLMKDGDPVKAGQTVANWDPHTHPIVSEVAGTLRFVDFVDGVTVQEQIDELTGLQSAVVTDPKRRGGGAKDLRPMIRLEGPNGENLVLPGTDITAQYFLPAGAIISLQNEAEVGVGDVVARIPQETSKTRDITGGLPRVAELFEARKPKDAAIIAEIGGTIRFGRDYKNKRRVRLVPEEEGAEPIEYLVPKTKHLMVQEGDLLKKGEDISDIREALIFGQAFASGGALAVFPSIEIATRSSPAFTSMVDGTALCSTSWSRANPRMNPFILPWNIRSNMASTSYAPSRFGSQS